MLLEISRNIDCTLWKKIILLKINLIFTIFFSSFKNKPFLYELINESFSTDAVLLLANMSQHFKFLSANLQFLKRHLKEKPEMLIIGKDVADATHLVSFNLN